MYSFRPDVYQCRIKQTFPLPAHAKNDRRANETYGSFC